MNDYATTKKFYYHYFNEDAITKNDWKRNEKKDVFDKMKRELMLIETKHENSNFIHKSCEECALENAETF